MNTRRQLPMIALFVLAFASITVRSFPLVSNTAKHHCTIVSSTSPTTTTTDDAVGMYVHIPFCRKRCHYCDFAIVPIGASSENNNNKEFDTEYGATVVKELELLDKSLLQKKKKLKTIYFGGGTPSLASVSTIQHIVSTLSKVFEFEPNMEMTMEMDPGTFTLSKLQALKQMGFNRVSLGVQSFDNDILKSIGRIHRSIDVINSIQMIQQVFSSSYSIDVISGLPGMSMAKWIETLELVTAQNPSHISVYDLQVEKDTVFGKWYHDSLLDDDDDDDDKRRTVSSSSNKKHIPKLPTAEESAFMYRYTSGYLRSKGYEHYEISSYAKPNQRSQHNQIYWGIGTDWYAVGMGAASSINGKRFTRPKQIAEYIQWVNQESMDWLPEANDTLVDMDQILDVIMTRLRTKEGLNMSWIEQQNDDTLVKQIWNGAQLGLDLNLLTKIHKPTSSSTKPDVILQPVDPDGFLFSNTIISNIFAELS